MGHRQRLLVDVKTGVYRYDQLIVLKNTQMPAVLLEAGSIINRDEELLMGSPERQSAVSAAVLDAVESFCAVRKPRQPDRARAAAAAEAGAFAQRAYHPVGDLRQTAVSRECLRPRGRAGRRPAGRGPAQSETAFQTGHALIMSPEPRSISIGRVPDAINFTAGAPHEYPQARLQPSLQCHARQPLVLTVKDLAVSRNFYVDLIGFIVSDEDKDTIYLRGVAEACHHSLVLKRAKGEPQAERVGMRVFTEEDLEKAKAFFEKAGLPAKWVEGPVPGPNSARQRSKRRTDRVLRHHGLEAALVVAFEHHRGRCRSGSIISSCWCLTCRKRASSG
jgi:hypothetical protein